MKHIIKGVVVLIATSIFILIACEQDESVFAQKLVTETEGFKLTGKHVLGSDILKENIRLKNFLTSTFSMTNEIGQEDISSSAYDFTIHTDEIQVIQSNTYSSYTFEVKRDTFDLHVAENYILTIYNDGSYSQLLATYPLEVVNGKLSYNFQTATIISISDSALLYSESTEPCIGTMQEIVEWDQNAGICVNYSCRPPSGNGEHQPGDSCSASTADQPYQECSGAWVVTGCTEIGGATGDDGPFDSPTGGGTTDSSDDTTDDENEVPIVPSIPVWQQIVECIDSHSLSDLNGTSSQQPLSSIEVSWLQNATRIFTSPMIGYLDTNSCSSEAVNFGNLAIDELMEGSEINYEEKIILRSSLDTYPCQKNIIVDTYSLRTPILDLFRDIFENDAVIDQNNGTLNITYSADNTGSMVQTAYTNSNSADNDFSFKTIFNIQSLENSTDLKIAGTTIHEAIHAVLLHFYYTGGLVVTTSNADPSYKELVEAFVLKRQQIGDTNQSQHEYMAELKDLIADGIYLWATTKSDYTDAQFADLDSDPNDGVEDGLLQYCKMIAWAGLTDTQAFDVLYPSYPSNPERMAIENAISYEISSGTQARGTKASTLTCND